MRISELSPELRRPATTSDPDPSVLVFLNELESSIREADSISSNDIPSLEKLASRLRKSLSRLSSLHPLSDSSKLQAWKLSYWLWNACVDLANTATVVSEPQAEIRQIACDLLLLADRPKGIPSSSFKSASFLYKTGLIWQDLDQIDRASSNFELATNLVSSSRPDGEDEKRLLLDLNLARARMAWKSNDRSLSIALLSRSKNTLFGSPACFQALAEQYLQFGKLCLKSSSSEEMIIASKLLTEALDLCEKGISISTGETLDLEQLKARCLRFMSAERLQAEDYEGVLRCVRVLRSVEFNEKDEHPSIGYIAMKACIGSGKAVEAEKELRKMMSNKLVPESACVSAAEAYLAATGTDSAMGIMSMLLGRCRGGAVAALRVVRMVGDGRGGCAARAVAAELAADERVVGLFVAGKERNAMHGLLWNWGAEHFRLKEYEIGAELFEKSMLYVGREEEDRSRRSNCFRVLSLCYIALGHLDRAQEFIDQAEKLDPNIKCSFLKFKIQLQKEDEEAAMNQIQAMVSCIDFSPEFLTLCTHEAISCRSFKVAVTSLSILLSLYTPGKQQMHMTEVAVLRNLITILQANSEDEMEILKYVRRARTRLNEAGREGFFGEGVVGDRELIWFAGSSWNMGLKMGKEKKYESCAEFFELAAEFYGECVDRDEGNKAMVCKSLILSAGAMINGEEENKISMADSEVKKAMGLLQKAEKMLSAMPLSAGSELAESSSLHFLHTFNTYQLLNRLDNTRNQQLQLIKNFAATKACNPSKLLHIALFASQGRTPNPEVSEFAFNKCLSSLLESPSPDYQMASMVLRHLVSLAGLRISEDDKKNEEAYAVYKQAYQIILGLEEGVYPIEEGKWMAMTAWNRAAAAVRLRQVGTARKWMKMGLDLAKRVRGMEKYVGVMEECFTNFEKICAGNGSREEQ